MNHWLYLFCAVVFEIAWATSMKWYSKQPGLLAGSVVVLLALVVIVLLSQALRGIPMGTAYAVWTGLGAVGVTLCGVLWFGESLTTMRLGCIALIVVGVAGLKISAA